MNSNEEMLPRVLVNSLPKSGTNLLTRLLTMLPGMKNTGMHLGHSTLGGGRVQPGEMTVPVGVDMPVAVPLPRLAMPLGRLKPGEFASAHIPYSPIFSSYLGKNGYKVAMIVRHPGDVVLSHARYIHETPNHPLHAHYTTLSTDAQFFASISGVELPEITLPSIGERFESIARWADDEHVHLIKFEDLVGEKGGGSLEKQIACIRGFAKFLGSELADETVTHIIANLFGQSSTFRSGQIGGWKTDLSSEHLSAIHVQLGQRLSSLGYRVAQAVTEERALPDPVETTIDSTTETTIETTTETKTGVAPEAMATLSSHPNLIYLVSQPRAGSTLLQRVLSGHSDIHTLAEPWVMLHPIFALRRQGVQTAYNATLANDALDDFMEALPNGRKDYVQAIQAMASTLYRGALANVEANHFLDKTPRYYYILGELSEVFPDAKIIILLRNPLAVLSSVLRTWVGKNWQRLQLHREDLLRAPALLVDGLATLNGQAIVLHYEKFVSSPETELDKLCAALEIPTEQQMLDYALQAPPKGRMGDPVGVKSHSRPVPNSLDKWKETFSYPTYRLLAEIMLTLVGRDVIAQMGYEYDSLYEALLAIPLSADFVAKEEIVDMISSLCISPAEVEKISPIIARYLMPEASETHAESLSEVPA